MPTLGPGCHWVPRCRTMILPARQASPPNFFTPRRWPAESRPLRDDPPAFLCAMIVSVLWGLLFDLMTAAQRSAARLSQIVVTRRPLMLQAFPAAAPASGAAAAS